MQLSEEIEDLREECEKNQKNSEEMNFETNNNITQMMIEDNEEKKYS